MSLGGNANNSRRRGGPRCGGNQLHGGWFGAGIGYGDGELAQVGAAGASAGTGAREGDTGKYAAGVVVWVLEQDIGQVDAFHRGPTGDPLA